MGLVPGTHKQHPLQTHAVKIEDVETVHLHDDSNQHVPKSIPSNKHAFYLENKEL